MNIELATIADVPQLLELQLKSFGEVCDMLNWHEAANMTETVAQAEADFGKYTTLKVCNAEGRIVGSVRGCVDNEALFIGRLMVLPEWQQKGIGQLLLDEIQSRLPHSRVWLYTCMQVEFTMRFYERNGFKTYKVEPINDTLSWAYMEK